MSRKKACEYIAFFGGAKKMNGNGLSPKATGMEREGKK
jgi:hypothetical protein